MPVAETPSSRFARRVRTGLRIATHPSLMRARIVELRHGPDPSTPTSASFPPSPWRAAWCNVCGWTGAAFDGPRHVEFQSCLGCGSNARDRFLFHCFVSRTPLTSGMRVLETSPRMGPDYRDAMGRWFAYTATDFDGSAHATGTRLDLQDPDLAPRSLDVLLCAHVLEHVPDTDRALAGIRRILAPRGRMYLQVPVLEGATVVPSEPEFHADHTPVFWRFGLDLASRLRHAGFATTVLVTDPLAEAVRSGDASTLGSASAEWDVPAIVAAGRRVGVTSVLTQPEAERLGLWHSEQFVTFECLLGDSPLP
jgi:SAM-dependent methyltransferase